MSDFTAYRLTLTNAQARYILEQVIPAVHANTETHHLSSVSGTPVQIADSRAFQASESDDEDIRPLQPESSSESHQGRANRLAKAWILDISKLLKAPNSEGQYSGAIPWKM